MKLGKIIGYAALGALILSAVPYQFKKDEETGAVEIRSLLWGLKKTPRAEGETKDHYSFAIPASGLDGMEQTAAETAEEDPDPEELPEV